MRWLRITVLVLTSQVAGCSFFFVSGPPENHASLDDFACTSSPELPVLDILWGAAYVGLFSYASGWSGREPSGTLKAVAVGGGGLNVASAFTGFYRVVKCSNALTDLAQRRGNPTRAVSGGAAVAYPFPRSPHLDVPVRQSPHSSDSIPVPVRER